MAVYTCDIKIKGISTRASLTRILLYFLCDTTLAAKVSVLFKRHDNITFVTILLNSTIALDKKVRYVNIVL